MKKIICLFTILCCSYSLFAQDTSMNKSAMMDKKMEMKHDGVYMKGGKMMQMMNGKSMTMTKDMTLKNGTMVMKDGSVKMKDGTTKMMKNGEMMDMDGKMMMHDDMMMNNDKMMNDDKMMHDSTEKN